MSRKSYRGRKDRKVFTQTARKTKSVNLGRHVPRGGIRE